MKGPFIVVVILVIATVLVTTTMERGRKTVNDTEVYLLYVRGQFEKVLNVMGTLAELTEEPRPSSLTWQYEVTNCLEELEQVRDELTATRPPKSLSDNHPEIADDIYESALRCLRYLTRASYLLLDYARTTDITYMKESTGELLEGQLCHATLILKIESALLKLSIGS